MKKLKLEKLKLVTEDVLQRNQMTTIYGGSEGSCQWICYCGGHPPISVWDCTDDPSGICEAEFGQGTGGACYGQ
ncbi:MAG: TIGR04149 family rSAM-modified RiPP [Cyclobacteriaceae bacterium]